ncbi:unnamed protein product [Rangifer tarandus platyrhynchus]|uniref:Uncharacterized protein n=1 Tax=Rangifer tarandus platyrhynchus TaxID=3082113 RepID=A0AC59YPC3_RANTA
MLAVGVSGSGRESRVSDVWTCFVGPKAPAHTAGGSLPQGPCGLTSPLTVGPSPRPLGREVWLPGQDGPGASGAQGRPVTGPAARSLGHSGTTGLLASQELSEVVSGPAEPGGSLRVKHADCTARDPLPAVLGDAPRAPPSSGQKVEL